MDTAVADGRITAGIAMLARDGESVWLATAGEMAPGIPMRDDAILPLASVGKMFTAIAAMILHERGVISLDDHVSKYIPEFADAMVEVVSEDDEASLVALERPIRQSARSLESTRAELGFRRRCGIRRQRQRIEGGSEVRLGRWRILGAPPRLEAVRRWVPRSGPPRTPAPMGCHLSPQKVATLRGSPRALLELLEVPLATHTEGGVVVDQHGETYELPIRVDDSLVADDGVFGTFRVLKG